MKRIISFTALLLLLLIPAAAPGAGYFIEDAGIKFFMPDAWETGSSNLGIVFTSPSGDMILSVGAMPAGQLGDALAMAGERVEQVMTGVEYEEGERELEINDFSGMAFSAWGKTENGDAFANFIVLSGENDHQILIFSMGEADAWENNEEDIQIFSESLLPTD